MKRNLTIIAAVLVVGLGFIIISKLTEKPEVVYTETNEERIVRILKEKYDEEFNQLTFIRSSDIPKVNKYSSDQEEDGTLEVYKIHSLKSDLDFGLYYDSRDKDKIIDTYELEKSTLSLADEYYDYVYNRIGSSIGKLRVSEAFHQFDNQDVKNKETIIDGLKSLISCPNNLFNYRSINFVINVNDKAYNFVKFKYSSLKEINQYIINKSSDELTISLYIVTSDNVALSFNEEGNIIIRDKNEYFKDYAKEENIDVFVQRGEYTVRLKGEKYR